MLNIFFWDYWGVNTFIYEDDDECSRISAATTPPPPAWPHRRTRSSTHPYFEKNVPFNGACFAFWRAHLTVLMMRLDRYELGLEECHGARRAFSVLKQRSGALPISMMEVADYARDTGRAEPTCPDGD